MLIQLPEGLESWLHKKKWTAIRADSIRGGYAAELYQITVQTDSGESLQAIYKSFAKGRSQELHLYERVIPSLAQRYAPPEYGRIRDDHEQGLVLAFAGTPLKHVLRTQSPDEQQHTVRRAAVWLAEMHASLESLGHKFLLEDNLNTYPIESSMEWGHDAITALKWLAARNLAGVTSTDIEQVDEMVEWFYPQLADWMEGRATLTHGDPHLENILVDKGEFRLIDWEFACVAVPQRDFAIFMQDILSTDLQKTAETEYYAVMKRNGWNVDAPQFETTFQACFFDNTLMMLGWEVHKFREGHLPENELNAIIRSKLEWLTTSYTLLQNAVKTTPNQS